MRIALGIPVIGDVSGKLVYPSHLVAAADAARCSDELVVLSPYNMKPHSLARTVIVQECIKRECDRLYFVDSDQVIPAGACRRLMDLMDAHRDDGVAMVTGHYYRRGYPYTCVWSKFHEDEWKQVTADEGVHEIHACGLGCALIDLRFVRERMKEPWFEMLSDDNGNMMIGDDVTFCEKLRTVGGRIFGDASIRCGHMLEPIVVDDLTVDFLRQRDIKAHRLDVALEVTSAGEVTERQVQNGCRS